MRRWVRVLVMAAAVSLFAAACGTQLPDSAFNVLGSGKPLALQGGGSAGPSAGPESSASAGPQVQAGSAGSAGTKGSKGTQGRRVSSGGKTGSGNAGAAGCTGGANKASDTGVTPNTIKIGTIVSGPGNPFAPNQFIVSYFGANSYFQYVNTAQGGVCGRTIQFIKCDDSGDRNKNIACAHKLVDQDKVFALVADNVYEYAGASYVSGQKVPDIGGQPISGTAYYTYPHLYAIIGSYYPNNGTPPSQYWGLSGLGTWFKGHLHLSRAGVIYYAQPDSQRGANYAVAWLKAAGVRVDQEQVPLFGDPSPQVQDMKANGDQAIFDALDVNGNAKVCQAMANYQYQVPKISTISTWTQDAGQALGQYPCIKDYYSWGESTNYADQSNPQVQLFQKAYSTFAPGAPVSQWSLEGWGAAMWFADAAKSCGADLTRACVEKFVNSPKGYGGHGLLDTHTTAFPHYSSKPSSLTQCYTIVKWGGSTWNTVVDHKNNCFTTPPVTYTGG